MSLLPAVIKSLREKKEQKTLNDKIKVNEPTSDLIRENYFRNRKYEVTAEQSPVFELHLVALKKYFWVNLTYFKSTVLIFKHIAHVKKTTKN